MRDANTAEVCFANICNILTFLGMFVFVCICIYVYNFQLMLCYIALFDLCTTGTSRTSETTVSQ